MNQTPPNWETYLHETAAGLLYPPTPDVASAVRRHLADSAVRQSRLLRRRLAWALLILALAGSALAVPQVRATLRQWLRIGTVQITLNEPTSAAQMPASAVPIADQTPATTVSVAPILPTSLRDFGSATTLAQAQQTVAFTITLPSEPADLGEPAYVLLPEPTGHIVVLIWLAPQRTDTISLSLHILDADVWARKMLVNTDQASATTVNGNPALWLDSDHEIYLFNPNTGAEYTEPRLVQGHTLLWAANGLTYRLETSADFAQARRIAESVR